jgi:hypothetical protein
MNERAYGNKRHRIFDGTKTQKKAKKAKIWISRKLMMALTGSE